MDAIDRVVDALTQWCLLHKIPDDHGLHHYLQVRDHALSAISHLSPERQLAVILACLLHDVDDRKLKLLLAPSTTSTKFPIATSFLQEAKVPVEIQTLVLEMIDLVAASKNGNKVPDDPAKLWMLIPRDCDRLESLGEVGVARCYEYTVRIARPLVLPETPLPRTEAELKAILEVRTLDRYIASGGVSASMLDHYLDKILHLRLGSNTPSLDREYVRRMAVMKETFFSFTRVFAVCKLEAPIYGQAPI